MNTALVTFTGHHQTETIISALLVSDWKS